MKYNTENIHVGDIVFAKGNKTHGEDSEIKYSVSRKPDKKSLILHHNDGPPDVNFNTIISYDQITSCPNFDGIFFRSIVRALIVI